MPRILSHRGGWLLAALLAAGAVAACNGYASIGVSGPYVGAGPVHMSTGVTVGFPL